MDRKIGKREVLVLRSLVLKTPCPKGELPILFDLDFEQEHMEYPLLLGILGVKTDWNGFPPHMRNHLEGVYKAARLRNIYGVPWLIKRCKILAQNDIPFMFLKGMAMRTYYASDIPRQMSDFDVAVPEDLFEKAKNCLIGSDKISKLGNESLHAVHIITDDTKVIDLHRWIFKTHGDRCLGVWDRAISIPFQGIDAKVLDPVDMFIHILDSKVRDDIRSIYPDRKVKWLMDAGLIAVREKDWDWAAVADRARQLGSENYVKRAITAFQTVFPELLSTEELKKLFPQDNKYHRWDRRVERYRRVNKEHNEVSKNYKGFTIKHVWSRFRYYWVSYHDYYGPELREVGETTNFFAYLFKVKNVSGFMELIHRFITNNRGTLKK
ncbi:MAG: nucleotidyltransferase family protein [Oscillospiraceae bacterium]|nr:nucleotidyltransferase family protein [Oscillospiraceae bacterium]